jgi:hypothetical protein
MHFRASSSYAAVIACVGHASMHRLHVPHRSTAGSSAGSSSVVSTSPSSTHDPMFSLITHVFFPTQPIPARAASSFSITGALSTAQRVCASGTSSRR